MKKTVNSPTSTAVHLMGIKFAIRIIMEKTVTNTASPYTSTAVLMTPTKFVTVLKIVVLIASSLTSTTVLLMEMNLVISIILVKIVRILARPHMSPVV